MIEKEFQENLNKIQDQLLDFINTNTHHLSESLNKAYPNDPDAEEKIKYFITQILVGFQIQVIRELSESPIDFLKYLPCILHDTIESAVILNYKLLNKEPAIAVAEQFKKDLPLWADEALKKAMHEQQTSS